MEIFKYVNRVNLSVILGLCLAFNPFSLVNAYEVQVGTSPTTTYRYLKDQDIPSKGGNSRDLQVRGGVKHMGRLTGNGANLSQSMGAGVTIEGLKGDTKVTATAKYSKKGVAKGLSRGLKFGKLGGPYGLAITTGLGLALDKLIEEGEHGVPDSYEFNEDGQIVAVFGESLPDTSPTTGSLGERWVWRCGWTGQRFDSWGAVVSCAINSPKDPYFFHSISVEFPYGGAAYVCDHPSDTSCDRTSSITRVSGPSSYDINDIKCPVGSISDSLYGCVLDNNYELIIDDSIIDLVDSIDPDALFENWGLEDYENIYPYIDENPTVVFDAPDSIVHDVEISSFTGSDGQMYHVENIAQTDFSVNSSGGLHSQTSEIQNTYIDGDLIDTQVNVSNSNVSSSGSSPAPAPAPEIPTDCDLFPSQCRHNEWVETPMDTPPPNSSGDFSDLGVNITLDDVQGVDVNFGEASCPAPIVVDLIIFEPVEITFYFMCEHAKSAKPFILISASLFALYIILGSNRGKA